MRPGVVGGQRQLGRGCHEASLGVAQQGLTCGLDGDYPLAGNGGAVQRERGAGRNDTNGRVVLVERVL